MAHESSTTYLLARLPQAVLYKWKINQTFSYEMVCRQINKAEVDVFVKYLRLVLV